jgi:large subunit ribosomal protein L1
MPNPKVGTVTMDIKGAISNIKKGAVQFRAEKAGIVQAGVGKLSFRNDRLLENIRTLIDAVQKEKPANIKGSYLKRIALSSTMGLGIKIDTKEL